MHTDIQDVVWIKNAYGIIFGIFYYHILFNRWFNIVVKPCLFGGSLIPFWLGGLFHFDSFLFIDFVVPIFCILFMYDVCELATLVWPIKFDPDVRDNKRLYGKYVGELMESGVPLSLFLFLQMGSCEQ